MLRRSKEIFFAACLTVVVALPLRVKAHGDLHDRIAELTVKIKADSNNSEFYFLRGELHRQHGDWNLALADFNETEKRNPKLQVNFARGRTWFDAGKMSEAKAALDKFISAVPTHAEARALRGRTLAKLGQYQAAAEDFSLAIHQSTAPAIDCFLQRAEAQIALKNLVEALRGLDEGIEKLGPVVSFQLRAIDLEIASKNYDGALARLETIAVQSPRKESWLARRGEILEHAGRNAEARKTFAEALIAIDSLPASRRNIGAMKDLENRISAALKRLEISVTKNSLGK